MRFNSTTLLFERVELHLQVYRVAPMALLDCDDLVPRRMRILIRYARQLVQSIRVSSPVWLMRVLEDHGKLSSLTIRG